MMPTSCLYRPLHHFRVVVVDIKSSLKSVSFFAGSRLRRVSSTETEEENGIPNDELRLRRLPPLLLLSMIHVNSTF